VEEFLEVGAYGSVRHPQALRDLLVRKAVRGQCQDLSLAGRQPTTAEIGSAVSTVRIPVSQLAHRFITRSAKNNRPTLSCAYL
jgi:hypothetical protein